MEKHGASDSGPSEPRGGTHEKPNRADEHGAQLVANREGDVRIENQTVHGIATRAARRQRRRGLMPTVNPNAARRQQPRERSISSEHNRSRNTCHGSNSQGCHEGVARLLWGDGPPLFSVLPGG
eukprot:7173442-Pyramimonas_sp.AAC.1